MYLTLVTDPNEVEAALPDIPSYTQVISESGIAKLYLLRGNDYKGDIETYICHKNQENKSEIVPNENPVDFENRNPRYENKNEVPLFPFRTINGSIVFLTMSKNSNISKNKSIVKDKNIDTENIIPANEVRRIYDFDYILEQYKNGEQINLSV
ncbi:hypothetical protein COEREDRAFT_89635 [Coemansia reversa NRRL 1564]|uniref:Uncharacterized protein n=1 Tax=Coemansia reversa (strain ATCC 12441 / NRRL 1564) TaxID=763665 RepID=A0A2G5B2Y3_COERN|nr:hypothetical protein COEREDRAFT_89635 [Coemansia reversa NRRL 1564]|eukprot:PIA13355.1 hypothetical protein COEREDRAFT_89635 [Coemansia reversa NRRL 1564]